MDIKKSFAKIFGRGKQSNVPILLGTWELENNSPDGFVIRNSKCREEWHFDSTSNGWITGVNRVNKLNPIVVCVNTKGFTGFAPVLMDKESVKHRKKLIELQRKAKD